MNGFEGSFMGDARRIDAATVLECGVCWWVYDPLQGDPVWQVAPGTAFGDLPAHWRCPNCDARQDQFLVLQAMTETAQDRPKVPISAGQQTIQQRQAELTTAYRRVGERMRGLPVYNDQLDIQVVGLRRCQHGLIGVVSTPWCMNLVLLGEAEDGRREGSSRELAFPSGHYAFIAGYLEGVGPLETCSLFSPMEAFDDPAAVRAVAEHAIEGLFQSPGQGDASISRRQFLRPGAAAER